MLSSIDAVVLARITLVDSEAPPATPTLIPRPTATDSAAAIDVTSIQAVSWASTVTAPGVSTEVIPTMLAAVCFSMRLWASAMPIEIEMLGLPKPTAAVMLAEAAKAIALIAESSLAVDRDRTPRGDRSGARRRVAHRWPRRRR